MPHQQPVLTVVSEDGHRFELIEVPALTAEHTLLLLPGMGLSARQYIPFAKALAELGTSVYIHEWRGIGASNLRASRRNDWGYRTLVELDLRASLEAVANRSHGPILIGGHSLGSQLACLLAARQANHCSGLILLAGGAPHWRQFPLWMQGVLVPAFRLMPAIAQLVGHYPGKALRFAGREARSVIADWARTGRTGLYEPPGFGAALEPQLAALQQPVLGLRMANDWYVPQQSLNYLLAKLPGCSIQAETVTGSQGKPYDHYRWMAEPEPAVLRIKHWLSDLSQKTAALQH